MASTQRRRLSVLWMVVGLFLLLLASTVAQTIDSSSESDEDDVDVDFTTSDDEDLEEDCHIQVLNLSGRPLQVWWIPHHDDLEPPRLMNEMPAGGTFPLKAKPGHVFELREGNHNMEEEDDEEEITIPEKQWRRTLLNVLPGNRPTSRIKGDHHQTSSLRIASFQVTAETHQRVTIDEDWHVQLQDAHLNALRYAEELLEKCHHLSGHDDDYVACAQDQLAGAISDHRSTIHEYYNLRDRLASHWEPYACADTHLPTSEALEEYSWKHQHKKGYHVSILHSRPTSQIHVVDDFVSPHECRAMQQAMEEGDMPLRPARVSDGKGGFTLHAYRKAWQGGVTVEEYDDEDDADSNMMMNTVAGVRQRIFDYANHVLPGLQLHPEGQEGLSVIQYRGRTRDDDYNEDASPPDEYKPHCDGPCQGKPHRRGNRVATMVLYCDVPTVGGHTNFMNAGVHVAPKQGSAVFFSYIEPASKLMDLGMTRHSGCPVLEGTKTIVTQWLRLGVDEDHPFSSFNGLGVQVNEEEEDDDYSDSSDDVGYLER